MRKRSSMAGCFSLAARYCSMIVEQPVTGTELASVTVEGGAGAAGLAGFFFVFLNPPRCGPLASGCGSAVGGGVTGAGTAFAVGPGPRVGNAIGRMCGFRRVGGAL